jgi:hypothetical protein
MSAWSCLNIPDQERFVWRHWGSDLLLYDEHSGETRLVSGWTGAVLALVQEHQPIDAEKLLAELSTVADQPDGDELRERIREAVDMLIGYEVVCDTLP